MIREPEGSIRVVAKTRRASTSAVEGAVVLLHDGNELQAGHGRRELDASDRRQPSMKRQTAAPPTQVTNIPLPVKVANPPLAVTVISGEQVNAFHEVSDLSNQVVHFFTVTAQGTDGSGKSVFAAAQSFHTTIGPFPVPTDVLVRMERNMFGSGTEAVLSVSLAGQLLHP
jgi:hypothetical protein